MGLFSRRQPDPVVHPEVRRVVHVRADAAVVEAQLGEYTAMQSPKHGTEHLVGLSTTDGWTTVELPRALHPWAFHNLAFWLLDTAGADQELVAVSDAGPTHPAYRLVREPELPDCLSGWDDNGEGWTVEVPTNDIVRGEAVPVPTDLPAPTPGPSTQRITILVEDPGTGSNPTNENTVKSRKALRDRHSMSYF